MGRSRDSLLRRKAILPYIRKVTTPVPVEGGVAGGALPIEKIWKPLDDLALPGGIMSLHAAGA